ncbi:MAG TPA: double-strand break repair helicase AddA [Sphingomonadaceae bacterium]|nr:double-strand break repair helicase AddA [Sphingomonadaceae bacterium]
MSGVVYPLHGSQRDAVDPQESVWLSASAGTGKTQVLSARVLRLLLQPGVEPSQLLCLTFTRAGAAEMAVRVNQVLARWVRMDDAALARDLGHIGADIGPDTRDRARSLFASVLDCPGGGLRIDTIHAFSQWLLSAFPEEAGLVPGTRAMEDRERDMLFDRVLGEMLVETRQAGDSALLDTVADLSLRKGPDAVESWLKRCASAIHLWEGPGAWQPPMRERVLALLGLRADAGEDGVAALCADDAFDVEALRACRGTLAAWETATGRELTAAIDTWLAQGPAERLANIEIFSGTLFVKEDFVTLDRRGKQIGNIKKRDPSYEQELEQVSASLQQVLDTKALLELAGWLTPALELGRQFARRWDEAKAREGLIDFDDQIRRASDLLTRSDLRDWIRYKLDRQFDHILVDEAQDTNEAQWRIILDGLCSEFFTGAGQRDGRLRTLFVVGDYKQAIFRFQGTSPENFRRARERVKAELAAAARNAREGRQNIVARELRELGLGTSFRTAQSVLNFVDNAIEAISYESFGLDEHPGGHEGRNRPGLVTLWPPVPSMAEDEEESEEGGDGNAGQPARLYRSDRELAERIARQVKRWLEDGYPLVKGEPRNAGPGDVMVLVRKRKELAALIVARLHAHGVPVAGVDRLRLGGPLAVQDLMAALRFAAQPLDDLNLASLLVSPLVGWSQQELLDFGWRPEGVRLWEHLRASTHERVRATLAQLGELLALADFQPPRALLHWLLVGPWRGRAKLLARLGREANDPIDELLNAALAHGSSHTSSLQGFIRWFDAGEGEMKREQGASAGQVRVMTVHGSKGLEAPIVILADAAGNPDDSPTREIELTERMPGGGEGVKVPLPGLSKEERLGPIRDAQELAERAEREEHWRLLYVAMTRAEEALYIGGSLNKREKDGPKEDSWFARLKPLFPGEPIADDIWSERWEAGQRPDPVDAVPGPLAVPVEIPAWARAPAGPEPSPPRPLAPSSAGEDEAPSPPFPATGDNAAAVRGTLLHALLERLPEVPPDERRAAALRWLGRRAEGFGETDIAEMAESALAAIAYPEWAEIFGPQALAEVPLAATVAGQVIAGTADRLLVTSDRVLVVDFKTAMRPPDRLEDIPATTLRQMAAYVAALEAIYPGRSIEAAVLYTHAPQLFALSRETVDRHKQALAPAQ